MSDEITEVPASASDWTNPIRARLDGSGGDADIDYDAGIQVMDELATQYQDVLPEGSYGGLDSPGVVLNILAQIDAVAIDTAAIRLHNTASERFRALADSDFEDLLSDSWTGDLADTFRQWVEGGGSYQGIDVFFEEVRRKSEDTALALLNISKRLKDALEELTAELDTQLRGLEDTASDNGHDVSSFWSYIYGLAGSVSALIGGGSGVLIALGVISGSLLAAIVAFIVGVIGAIVYLWDYYRVTAEDIQGSMSFMEEFWATITNQERSTGLGEQTEDGFDAAEDLEQSEFHGDDA